MRIVKGVDRSSYRDQLGFDYCETRAYLQDPEADIAELLH